jgi:Protein of unknown function (DUF3040)
MGREYVCQRLAGEKGGAVSTPDVSLNAEERAALASIEAKAAAEDPQLAALLKGSGRGWLRSVLPRLAAVAAAKWRYLMAHSWLGFPITLVGLALVVAGMSGGLVVGLIGAVLAAAGLRMGLQAVDDYRRRTRSSSS